MKHVFHSDIVYNIMVLYANAGKLMGLRARGHECRHDMKTGKYIKRAIETEWLPMQKCRDIHLFLGKVYQEYFHMTPLISINYFICKFARKLKWNRNGCLTDVIRCITVTRNHWLLAKLEETMTNISVTTVSADGVASSWVKYIV